jgi:hypothetical protein
MPAKSYDSKCFDLADAFLSDEPHLATDKNTDELAATIQSTIEDFIADKQRNYEPPDPMAHVEFPFARNH